MNRINVEEFNEATKNTFVPLSDAYESLVFNKNNYKRGDIVSYYSLYKFSKNSKIMNFRTSKIID